MSNDSSFGLEDMYASGTAKGKKGADAPQSSGSGGITKEVQGATRVGRRPVRDTRGFTYDEVAALASDAPVKWHVSKADRMPKLEAARKMEQIMEMYGFHDANPVYVHAFRHAFLFCHTMNSASVVQPDRGDFYVNGVRFPFQQAVAYLGPDLRRFFRAFANETREVNLGVLERAYNVDDIEAIEKAEWLREVAENRGLFRYPELAHDSASACWGLPAMARAALAGATVDVQKGVRNVADSVTSNSRFKSDDPTIYQNPAEKRGSEY